MAEEQADVVVIGAGAVGSSAAYHLAKAGCRVALVERGSIASGCSSATYANIMVSSKEPAFYTEFNLESARLLVGLEQELGVDLEYCGDGSIAHVVEKESDWPVVLSRVDQLNGVPGVRIEVLRTPEAQQLEPALPLWIQGATFCPANGRINPFNLVEGYVKGARRCGAVVHTGTEVRGIETRSGAVESVVTSRGKINTSWVVNAAGVDSPNIGLMVGVVIPVVPAQGQVVTTMRVKPFLRHHLPGLAQTASGNLLVGFNKSFIGYGKEARIHLIPANIRKVIRLFPFLADVQVERIWVGVRPWPIDGLPVLGPVADVRGFLIATCHSAITLSEIIGRVITGLVVEGRSPVDIDPYRPDRFKAERLSYVMNMYSALRTAPVGTAAAGVQPVRPASTLASLGTRVQK